MFKVVSRYTVLTATLLIRLARFVLIVGAFYIVYKLLFEQLLDGSRQILPALAIWLLSAYVVLPKIHRTLTTYYLPNYFVGRIRSGSGLLADPVNVALFGSAKDLHKAMGKAGWKKADPLTFRTFIRAAIAVMLKRSYPAAPVGNMYLFNRVQDFAYEIEMNGSPSTRHHVRFWKTPGGWRLPGGHKVDWLAAATYDTNIGIKIATGQIDHLIHINIDEERDFLVESLKTTGLTKKVETVEHFTNAYHDRNNGGDRIQTDGNLPFIYL